MYNFFIAGVQLPIPPPAMTMKINNKNEVITLINEGEVNLLKKPGLTDISFDVEFPNVRYPYAVYPSGFQLAAFYLEHLENLKIAAEPFYFIVNRMKPNGLLLFDTNMLVSLEDYEIVEDAENGFDVVTNIRLKQYRPFGTKRLVIQQNATAALSARAATSTNTKVTVEKVRATTGKTKPKTHTVKSGDTLWAIAKRYLGDGSKADYLAKINNIKNKNRIDVGQVIKLE